MTRDEKLKILRAWEISVKAFRQNVGVLSNTIREDVLDQLFELETAYTNAIALIVGDNYQWLYWYSTDNNVGDEGLEVVVKFETDEKTIKVKSIEDLLRVIEDEH